MTILRIQKHETNFVVLDKTFVNDPNISMQAKGLLTYLLSLPNNWRVNIQDLTKRFSNGKHAISSTINELIKVGYIERYRSRKTTGKFASMEYCVHEQPISTQLNQSMNFLPDDFTSEIPQPENQLVDTETPQPENQFVDNKPQPDFPALDFPSPENQSLINNIYTKQPNNKEEAEAANTPINVENTVRNNSASAALFLSPVDRLIADALTPRQYEYVTQAVTSLFASGYFPCELEEAISAVTETLLSATAYKKAGTDFLLKLNTIKKSIQNGTWTPPVERLLKTQEKMVLELEAWQQQRKKLVSRISDEDKKIEQFTHFKTLALQRNQLPTAHDVAIQNALEKRAALLVELSAFAQIKPDFSASAECQKTLVHDDKAQNYTVKQGGKR